MIRWNVFIGVLTALLAYLFSFPLYAANVSSTNGSNVTIPDEGGWVYSPISISNAPAGATVTSVEVSFSIVHPYSGDLVVDLEVGAHSNSKNLWNKEGAGADNPSRTVTTSNFNGLPVNNTWYLYARDTEGGDSGYINSWSITIYYSAPSSPIISSVSPTSMPGSDNRQTLTINGTDFDGGSETLTFDPPSGSNIESTSSHFTSRSSTRLKYSITNANDVGTWRV